MGTVRQLHDTVTLAEIGWRAAAEDFMSTGGQYRSKFSVEGIGLADAVVVPEISLSLTALKSGVAWARAHDAEAAQRLLKAEAIDIAAEDEIEALARRIAYLAGRDALGKIGSETGRLDYRRNNRQRQAGLDILGHQAVLIGIDVFDITKIRIK